MLPRLLPLALLISSVTLSPPTFCQTVGGGWPTFHQLQSDAAGYARAACRVEDLDADMVADFAVGLPFFTTINGTEAGAVRFYSGATGTLIRTTYGASNFEHFGQAIVGLGDVNNDGVGDYLVGAPEGEVGGLLQAGSVFLFSGADGSQILRIDGSHANGLFGFAVANAGDLDRDLSDDFLVGAPGNSPNGLNGAGQVFAYSGATGSLLASYSGEAAGDSFGISVAGAGDVNHDLFFDVLVGAATTDVNFRSNCGSAIVFSGQDGGVLWRANGQATDDYFGHSVAAAGDLNRDGHADIIVGAPGADPHNLAFAGTTLVFSGSDGSLMFQLDGLAASDGLGTTVANAGDVDGDTVNDIVAGAPEANFHGGYVAIFSGSDGSLMNIRDDSPWPSQLGFAVCGLGDLNNDGRSEVLATAPYVTPTALADSYVYVYGFNPYLTSDRSELSDSVGGTVLFSIDFPTTVGNNPYKLLGTSSGTGSTSIGGIDVPLTPGGLVWDSLASNSPPPVFTNASGMLNADGNASSLLSLPAGVASALIDTDIHFAALAFQLPSTGLASSSAVSLRILP